VRSRSRSRPRRTVLLVLVLLAIGGGIGWGMLGTGDRSGATNSTAATAGRADPGAASTITAASSGPDGGPTTTGASRRSTHTTVASGSATTSMTTPSSVTPPSFAPLLQQPTTRPEGVAALMDLEFGAGDGEEYCAGYPEPGTPTVAIGSGDNPSVTTLQVATALPICLLGFQPGTEIEVTIQSTLGLDEGWIAPAPSCGASGCTSLTAWAAIPGSTLGRYDLTAVQGDLSAKGRIALVAADGPRLMVIGSTGNDLTARVTVQPGTTIGIALAGFAPNQSIGLLFYYTPSFDFGGEISAKGLVFRGATTVTIDDGGGAVFWLETSTTDSIGCYAVNTWPPLRALEQRLNPPYPREVWISGNSSEQFCLKR
jgi:hypothetical protein